MNTATKDEDTPFNQIFLQMKPTVDCSSLLNVIQSLTALSEEGRVLSPHIRSDHHLHGSLKG